MTTPTSSIQQQTPHESNNTLLVSSITQMDQPQGTNYFRWFIILVVFSIYFYFAREYPQWKAKKLLHTPAKEEKDNQSSTLQTTPTNSTPTSPTTPPTTEPPSPWPEKFSVRWIPYLPFAVIYLVLKAIISSLRLFVLNSLFAIENTSFFLKDTTEEAVQWSVNHGPEFVQTKVVVPVHTAAVKAWKSPTMEIIKAKMESTVFPSIVRLAISCREKAQVTVEKTVIWLLLQVEPTCIRLEWFAVECVYNPSKAVWARLVIVGRTFAHSAKVYLHELGKDARDLGQVFLKLANWMWTRTLRPLGTKLYILGGHVADKLVVLLPWLAQSIYTKVLQPVAAAAVDGFHILRSHPTLLAGLQALSSKAQGKFNVVMQRLESVNWLVLLETVLTTTFTTIYHFTTTGLQLIGNGVNVFITDFVPNAYNDLKMALEVARPIVAWATEKFVKVAYPVWQVISWISWNVAVNARPTAAWLYANVFAPAMKQWESTIQPGLTYVSNVIVTRSKALGEMIVRAAPMTSTIVGPMWAALVKMTEAMQVILGQMGSHIVQLSADLAEKIKEYGTTLGPKIEVIKEQSTQLMDEAVVATSDFMVDWVKKEKRD
ncbi:hypothetical protein BGZ49_001265 [Haplosporangium sp. Z 27]|nr:hypothetical protein BGZ49_001265 [Haplosporangium sp. Z 27]